MSDKAITPAITATKYMVQWEEHPSHLASRLGQLLEQQTLVDVTLMCNTHTLRVHRAVLAACSPYFETILQRQLGVHPLIVLKDMQFNVLKSLIEFMYCGETSVTEENLGPLLQAAKFFQVKGLSSMTKEALGLPSTPSKPTTAPSASTPLQQTRTVAKTTGRTTTTTTVRNPTGMSRTEAGTASATSTTPVQRKTTLLASGQQSAANAAALARGKRVVTTQQTAVRPGQGPTTVYGQPRRTIQQTSSSTATTSSTVDSGQPWRASTSPKDTQQHADTAQLLLSLSSNEYQQQKGSSSQVNVTNKAAILNKGRVGSKVETPNGGLKAQTATTTGGLNKIVMKSTPQQQAAASIARKRLQQTIQRPGQSTNMLVNKQAETSKINSPNQVIHTRTQPATYAQQKRKQSQHIGVTGQTNLTQNQQQLVAVTTEEEKTGSEQTTSVVYQLEGGELAGNVVYQLDESLLAASDANIVYQLPDGTTVSPSELQGNMLYQVASEEPQTQVTQTEQAQVESETANATSSQPSQQYLDLLKAAGIPTDMPVLLDNGNGEYVAVNEEMLKSMVNGGMLQIADSNGEPMQLVVQEEQQAEASPDTPTTSADLNKPEAGQSMPSLDLENQQIDQTVTTTAALAAQSMPTLEETNTSNEGLSVEQALEAMMGVGSEPENKTQEIIETTTNTITPTTSTIETTEAVLKKDETEQMEPKETTVEGNNEMDVIDQLIQESTSTQEESTIQTQPEESSQENIKEILEETTTNDTIETNPNNETSNNNKRKLSTENIENEQETKKAKLLEENIQEEETKVEQTEEIMATEDSVTTEVDKEKTSEVNESVIKE